MLYDIMLDDVTSTYAVSRWSDVFIRKQPRIGSVVRCEFPQGTKSANTLGGFPSFCGNKLPEAHSKLDIFKKPTKKTCFVLNAFWLVLAAGICHSEIWVRLDSPCRIPLKVPEGPGIVI